MGRYIVPDSDNVYSESDEARQSETLVTRSSTGDGGQPRPAVDNSTSLDLVQAALADARGIVRTTPRRRGTRAGKQTRQDTLAGRRTGRRGANPAADPERLGGYSGAGPDLDKDPQLVGTLLNGYVNERGWQRPLAEGRVFADWSGLVGDGVAAHCTPQTLRDGELQIVAESTAWATQLRLLSSTLLARLVAELGPDLVTKLRITGPTGPSWKHGGWSVRGARGPRDTYG